MKKSSLIAAVGFGVMMVSQTTMAGHNGYYDTARVLQVQPVFQTVQVNHPSQQCWEQPVYHSGGNTAVPTITGAIIGGAIGNQFGRGHGRDAMTVAGMLLGGAIGNDMGRQNSYGQGYQTMERRCSQVNHYTTRQEVVGYRVKYRYNGHVNWTRTATPPGRYIRVNVRPAHYNGYGMF